MWILNSSKSKFLVAVNDKSCKLTKIYMDHFLKPCFYIFYAMQAIEMSNWSQWRPISVLGSSNKLLVRIHSRLTALCERIWPESLQNVHSSFFHFNHFNPTIKHANSTSQFTKTLNCSYTRLFLSIHHLFIKREKISWNKLQSKEKIEIKQN